MKFSAITPLRQEIKKYVNEHNGVDWCWFFDSGEKFIKEHTIEEIRTVIFDLVEKGDVVCFEFVISRKKRRQEREKLLFPKGTKIIQEMLRDVNEA
jgi:hypothetical protein